MEHPEFSKRLTLRQPWQTEFREIRLLVVEPGIDHEIVQCSFRYARLDGPEKPRYETVSYVWGDSTIRATVSLEGRETHIPASSERVIRRFRLPNKQRVIWIDALCINQDDNEERSSQVDIMDKIYSDGRHNLIWLGESCESTPLALNHMGKLVDEMRTETNDFENATTMLYTDVGSRRYSNEGLKRTLTRSETDALCSYFSSEWFQRLWVVQEAALSVTSICHIGDDSCPLRLVLRAAAWLRYKFRHLPYDLSISAGLRNAEMMFNLYDRDIGRYILPLIWDFGNILLELGDTHASDPRDHIFGVLGLARKFTRVREDSPLLHPDYRKSVAQVFCDATMYCILELNNLRCLNWGHHRIEESSIPGLPSWAPDWSQSFDNEKDPSGFSASLFRADCGEVLRVKMLGDGSSMQLHVTGVIFSKTAVCSSVLKVAKLRDLRQMSIVSGLESVLYNKNVCSSLEGDLDHVKIAMCMTGGTDYLDVRWDEEKCRETAAAYDRVVQTGGVPLLVDLTAESTNDERLAAQFRQASFSCLYTRRIFTTSIGKLGVGPQTMQPSDLVAILFGCPLPVILRRKRPGAIEFEFVGTCYVYGIMDGEAVAEHRAAGEKDMEFILV